MVVNVGLEVVVVSKIWQLFPWNPVGHEQKYEVATDWEQIPLFWHGFGKHELGANDVKLLPHVLPV